MRTSTIGGDDSLSIRSMSAGHTAIRLIFDIFGATNKFAFQFTKHRFLRKGHVPEAIAGTSSLPVQRAKHVQPENRLAFLLCKFLGTLK